MKGVRIRSLLVLLAIAALMCGSETEKTRPQPSGEKNQTQFRENDRLKPPEVKEIRPSESGVRPSQAKREGAAEEPRQEPRVPSESEARRAANPPNSAVAPIPAPPSPAPVAPEPTYRSNEPARPYGERGGDHGRTFHGEHDRWRYDRFRGSWDFLIFPGPVIYAPQSYYGPNVSSHIAGVHVEYSGSDATGSDFAGSVNDQLRENDMGPVASASDASLELYIISMDEEPTNPGYGSAVSVSYILMPESRFITAQMLDVGSEQIDALASSVVSYARQLLDEYR